MHSDPKSSCPRPYADLFVAFFAVVAGPVPRLRLLASRITGCLAAWAFGVAVSCSSKPSASGRATLSCRSPGLGAT